jgi:hypothetical protein
MPRARLLLIVEGDLGSASVASVLAEIKAAVDAAVEVKQLSGQITKQ